MTIEVVEDGFGEAEDPLTGAKETVRRFTFKNEVGIAIQVITLGATITTIKIPEEGHRQSDVVLGFDDVKGYQSSANPYFGCTVGRVCNRIADGEFILDDEEITLSRNFKNTHHLHGGFVGLDKVIWDAQINDDKVIMSHTSKDGHEGYPGELKVQAKFQLSEDNRFCIHYVAWTTKTTVVNLTNHTYFNLGDHNSGTKGLFDHIIKIRADTITETNDDSIPTGEFRDVEKTSYDFREMTPLYDRFKEHVDAGALGYDDNYCINLNCNNKLPVAKVAHAQSGRSLEVFSNQPGIQFYTANYFPDPEKDEEPIHGKEGAKYYKHGAFCLETQKYPDAVHHPNFPSIILKKGELYCHDLVYKFGFCIGEEGTCQSRRESGLKRQSLN